ncbi:GNAT family N-acetyltransferase [Gluconobacter sp. Dm-62]|nr:GNAT family N-acetyltransferase [Gluconobacter sp. Dm-62]
MNRIFLTALRPEDAADMFSGLSDERAYRFIPDDPPVSPEALRDRYVFLSAGGRPDTNEIWLNWIIRRTADQQAVGYTQATLTGKEALIAYHIFPDFWRQGIATQAMTLTLKNIFDCHEIRIVRAFVDTRNAASIALLKTLGFNLTRTIPDADFFKGSTSHEYEFKLEHTGSR